MGPEVHDQRTQAEETSLVKCGDKERKPKVETSAKHPFVVDGDGHGEEVPARDVEHHQRRILGGRIAISAFHGDERGLGDKEEEEVGEVE